MQSTTFYDHLLASNPNLANFAKFWQKFSEVAEPYWYPKKLTERTFPDVMRAWGMVILLIVLIIALVAATAFNSFVDRYLIDVIVDDKNIPKFFNALLLFTLTAVVITLLTGFSKFVRKRIAIDWYEWINDRILEKYLRNSAYYRINFRADIENPDQRLSQEIEPIAKNFINFVATFFEKSLEMFSFAAILWLISPIATAILIIYTLVGNLIAIYLTDELDKITQEELEHKADYSYGLTHVRNHAESIAFFQGENEEGKILQRRFKKLLGSSIKKIDWEKNKDIFNRGYRAVIQIFPFLMFAPAYIRGEVDFGQVNQAFIACTMFANGFATLIDEYGNSGKFTTYIERLSGFSGALDALSHEPENVNLIETLEENRIAFEDITLETPDYEKIIVEDLSMSVEPGKGLLIVGPSGRGKSSLLRAIAGLWNAGTGQLIRPPLEQILFLPQRPYIILGNLREQLLYPHTNRQISEQELKQILHQVNLQNILTKVDSFEAEVPWENILSLGEQQRLAFARLLVTHPNYVILDEATSALDLRNEELLYQQLQQTQSTFISVGHRESLFPYHQWVLELYGDSDWRLIPMEEYRREKEPTKIQNSNMINSV